VAGPPRRQDVNVDGKIVKDGVALYSVCVNTAKDLLHNRLQVHEGPGCVHLSSGLPDEFYEELVSEVRVQQKVAGGLVTRWVKPNSSVRNERLDTAVLALFGAHRMKLHQYTDAEWRRLELLLCPPTVDLFAPPVPEPLPAPEAVPAIAAEVAAAAAMQPQPFWSTPRRRRVLSKGIE
jgi:phage terminase large subunit GpA-like protein